jgi:hypothetical protein
MQKRRFRLLKFGLIVACCSLSALSETEQVPRDFNFKGTAFTEEGAVQGGRYLGTSYQGNIYGKKPFLSKSAINLALEATMNTRLKIVVQPEVQIWFPTYSETWIQDIQDYRFHPNTSLFIQNGFGQYSFGDVENSPLRISIGTFLYKYNDEVMNLGEYLFRSGCYPQFLTTDFDFPCARLTGIHFNSALFGALRQDVLITREQQIEPLQDYSISYTASFAAGNLFDVGAGVSFWRCISAENGMTSPRYYYNEYITGSGDTANYSFAGTKLMGRFAFDPKPLINMDIFGSEDLVLYAEAAVLGLKDILNYKDTIDAAGDTSMIRASSYYDSLWQRIPVMFGIHVPTFKMLDILAVEAEWWGNRFPNNYYYKSIDREVFPIPAQPNYSAYRIGVWDYHKDDWKWSVYAKKTIVDGWALVGQIANDHLRHRIDREKDKDEMEMLSTPTDWYWILKAQFNF